MILQRLLLSNTFVLSTRKKHCIIVYCPEGEDLFCEGHNSYLHNMKAKKNNGFEC